MKKLIASFVLLLSLGCFKANAQDLNDPGGYLSAINSANVEMSKTYMAYISAAAHSGRARKIERMRQQTVDAIINCRGKISELPYYKGDNSLRKSSIDYIGLVYKVFNDDYAHIVNMEEIVEQSFDEMQLYLLLQEKTNDTLKAANDRMDQAVTDFAAKYNVKLLNDKSELGQKMDQAGKVSKYRDKVYLLFFKCNWQENQLTDALNKKNTIKIEQARSALSNYASDGLAALDSLKSFQNDPSLAVACKQALTFYKKEADVDIPKVSDFMLKEENFNKIKTSFDATPQSSRTQKDVDAYNKAVNEMNGAVNVANQTNANLNNNRKQIIDGWNNAEKSFNDNHVPFYK